MSQYLMKGPITPEIISSRIARFESRKDTGGHSIFLGQVRDDFVEGEQVTAIEYSAYEQMTDTEVEKIITEISIEFSDVLALEILHSTGIVMAGQISLFVIVSAGHRDHAIRACRQTVELLKQRLPIWKKELFADNSSRWKNS